MTTTNNKRTLVPECSTRVMFLLNIWSVKTKPMHRDAREFFWIFPLQKRHVYSRYFQRFYFKSLYIQNDTINPKYQ